MTDDILGIKYSFYPPVSRFLFHSILFVVVKTEVFFLTRMIKCQIQKMQDVLSLLIQKYYYLLGTSSVFTSLRLDIQEHNNALSFSDSISNVKLFTGPTKMPKQQSQENLVLLFTGILLYFSTLLFILIIIMYLPTNIGVLLEASLSTTTLCRRRSSSSHYRPLLKNTQFVLFHSVLKKIQLHSTNKPNDRISERMSLKSASARICTVDQNSLRIKRAAPRHAHQRTCGVYTHTNKPHLHQF